MKQFISLLASVLAIALALTLASCQRENPISTEFPSAPSVAVRTNAPVVSAIPEGISVPDGYFLVFHAHATGVQIYKVQQDPNNPSVYSWVFQAPEATLYEGNGGVVGKHYAGPTWETTSGSKVVGAKVAAAPSTNPNSVPQLLLRGVSSQGPGVLDSVKYIQRLNTDGGNAPSTGADADHVGDIVRVPYTADYYFYRAQGPTASGAAVLPDAN
jgi:hypothetical protein